MSKRAVLIRRKVRQYQRTHTDTNPREAAVRALAVVVSYGSEHKGSAQRRALDGPYHGNGNGS